jgi:hypothetical protein
MIQQVDNKKKKRERGCKPGDGLAGVRGWMVRHQLA